MSQAKVDGDTQGSQYGRLDVVVLVLLGHQKSLAFPPLFPHVQRQKLAMHYAAYNSRPKSTNLNRQSHFVELLYYITNKISYGRLSLVLTMGTLAGGVAYLTTTRTGDTVIGR